MISFFRKYQKPMLITAALFALVTFSVTPLMMDFVQQRTGGEEGPRPWMTFPSGRDYQVTDDDRAMAWEVFQYFVQRFPMLNIGLPDGEDVDEAELEREKAYAYDRLLILMCAARDAGIGLSNRMVAEFANSQLAKYWLRIEDQSSYEQAIAQRFGATSVQRFEAAFAEYVRVQFYIDSLTLGENLSVLSVLEKAAKEGEELQAELVRFSAEDHEAALKKEEIGDEALLEFLAGLESGEKSEFLDRKLVDLEVAWLPVGTPLEGLEKAVSALDPAEGTPGRSFLEDLGKLPPIADPQVERRYDQDKATLYVKPKEAPASQAASGPATRPSEAPETPKEEESADGVEQEFVPLDEALMEKIRTSLQLERALGLVFSRVKTAALEQGKTFDMAAYLEANFPFLTVVRTGLQRESNLSTVTPLEGWSLSYQALAPAEGEFLITVYNSRSAHFFARVAEVKENEPRPIGEIRDSLKALYVKKEARNRAEKGAKDFVARLRQLGRKARPEALATIDEEVAKAVEGRLASRRAELDANIARIEKTLADSTLPARFRPDYETALTKAREELEALPEWEAEVRREEEEKREAERKALELKDAGAHFAEAAETPGARFTRVDFFARNFHQLDRDGLEEEQDDGIKYLKGSAGVSSIASLEKGGVTDPIEDHASRSFLLFHLVDRRDRDLSQLTPGEVQEQLQKRRREARSDFARKAFSFEELRRRFDYRGFSQEEEYKARLEGAGDPVAAPASAPASAPAVENGGSAPALEGPGDE